MDKDAHKARALVIAGNPSARSLMVAQLRDLGLGDVRSSHKLSEARLLLERQEFDVVLCDDDLDTKGRSAQELLDELRRENLMPYGTVFVLITAEATYARVTEAAEGGLDSVLVRPYTAVALGERLAEARRRKRTLQPIFDAAAAGRTEQAESLCLGRWRERQPYGLFCARVAAEWMLRAGRGEPAMAVYREVQEREAQPWAELGLARARLATGDLGGARRQTETLVQRGVAGADACDLLGRILVEQGEYEAAAQAARRAVMLTPHCLLRLQQAGALAFHLGEFDEARQMLDRAIANGVQSKLFDGLTLLLLALLRHDQRDAKGTAALAGHLRSFSEARPESGRLRRLRDAAAALQRSAMGDRPGAQALAAGLLGLSEHDECDLELVLTLLWLAPRLPLLEGSALPEASYRWALRFSTTRAATEALCSALRGRDDAIEEVRRAHAEILALAESAMQHSLRGAPAQAALSLAEDGERTRNAKLIELGQQVLRRHLSKDESAAPLSERLAQARERWCRPSAHIAGMLRTQRSPGGLALRG